MTEAQKRAAAKYAASNTRYYGIKLSCNTDADLIELLDAQDNKQGFIKRILDDYLNNMTRRTI